MAKRKITETELEPSLDCDVQEEVKIQEGDVSLKKKAVKKSKNSPGEAAAQGAKKRFIVFVGNLPYSVSKEDLENIFAESSPSSIRLLTDKVTKKPRGIAFLEFSQSSDLEMALSKHHSDFKGRRINVELTVGGGGNKSEDRKKKIKAKNENLSEERKQKSQKHASF